MGTRALNEAFFLFFECEKRGRKYWIKAGMYGIFLVLTKWITKERGRQYMSQLVGIVQRLKSLQEGGEQGEVQQRLFELNGKTLCQVKYFPNKDTFELEVYDKDGKGSKYPFDDIDMTAIEIFELLQEAKQEAQG